MARPTSDEQWSLARRVARELDKVLDGGGPRQVAIARAAAELRLTTRQIYNLLARYRADRTVTAFAAMSEIQAMLPGESGRLISSLWHEYEGATTPEARFARALDHLEVQAQHNLASLDTWESVEHDLVYTKMDDRSAYDSALRAMVQVIRVQAEKKLADGGYDVPALRVRHGLPSQPSKDPQKSCRPCQKSRPG